MLILLGQKPIKVARRKFFSPCLGGLTPEIGIREELGLLYLNSLQVL